MSRLFHVTSSKNRDSIRRYGLDWERMGADRGIAGSTGPEQEGCFLCLDMGEVEWFLGFPSYGTWDVWAVSGVAEHQLVESPEGHYYLPERVPPDRLELLRQDVPAAVRNRALQFPQEESPPPGADDDAQWHQEVLELLQAMLHHSFEEPRHALCPACQDNSMAAIRLLAARPDLTGPGIYFEL